MEKDSKPTVLFSGTSMEAGMVQSFIEAHGIQAFLINDHMGTLEPWVVAAGGLNPVKVLVSESDYPEAAALLEEFHSGGSLEDNEQE